VNLRKAGRQFRRAQNGPDSFGPVCGRDKTGSFDKCELVFEIVKEKAEVVEFRVSYNTQAEILRQFGKFHLHNDHASPAGRQS
jgi:hypothetical protein